MHSNFVPAVPLRVTFVLFAVVASAVMAQWSWQQPHAKVLPTGDLEWTPQAYRFEAGSSVRYIDHAAGKDTNNGDSKDSPWKHHPWDANATDTAAACEGIHTYVFKCGVMYRGTLLADESGTQGNPIRLNCDPSWGKGDAVICGSERVTRWSKGAEHPDIPNASAVAFADLDFTPRNVWLIEEDGDIVRLLLARTPNWTVSDPDDIKSEWWQWDNPENQWGSRETVNGIEVHIAFDTKHLNGPLDYYKGAYIWSEYGWVMSTPYATRITQYQPARHALVFSGQWGGGAGSYHIPRYARYYLEDKPHYLDEPGEFWFEKKGKGGRLYLRLPGDRDPNTAHIEAAKRLTLIDSTDMNHVHVSGLTFRFTNPYWDLDAPPVRHRDVDSAAIRLLGRGSTITVSNCVFEHVHLPVRIKAMGDDAAIDGVVVRDSVFQHTDDGAMELADGSEWGKEYPKGRMYDVKVLRNKLFQTGQRPNRYRQGHAIVIDCAETVEVAGNVGHRLYGSGIFIYGGKRGSAKTDRPLTRILVHHNKMTDTLLNTNDWGAIETWQGGSAYVYDNVVGNPRGFKMWGYKLQSDKPSTSTFGHAYYMDGGYKQFYFNNIAWGKSKDPYGPLGNCAAFQEIHGYLASIFNNTAYNFIIGSRRQSPEAGRNKYMGNIWHGIGEMVFRHARPSNKLADPNAADAGEAKSEFHLETNAYVGNVFYDVPENIGVFEPDGKWHRGAESFRDALALRKSIGDLGEHVSSSPLTDPARHDFRPTERAANRGVRVFVPWGVYATVGEWPFYHAGDDHTRIVDEHFHLAPYYVERTDYKNQPAYPLKAMNMGPDAYTSGPLEDWTQGALRLNGEDQYAVLTAVALGEGPQQETVEIKNKTFDWVTFDAPESITPGKPIEVTVHLKGVDPSLKVAADLHWQRGTRFGGLNVWGGGGKKIPADGNVTLTYKPKDKPGLTAFVISVWTTPTGEWGDRVQLAQHTVAKGSAAVNAGYRSPAVDTSSFLIEMYFRTKPGQQGAVLVKKMGKVGYSLGLADDGGAAFTVKGDNRTCQVATRLPVNDGRWHHVIAEADRTTASLSLYLDGKKAASAAGVGPGVSLQNDASMYVGGTPEGRCLAGTLEFLRIALGTLVDSKTTIEELYAWQFAGPFLKDFCGAEPRDKRDAGALEMVPR